MTPSQCGLPGPRVDLVARPNQGSASQLGVLSLCPARLGIVANRDSLL
jgi:hypothetical protein